jgi:hypothetical protein
MKPIVNRAVPTETDDGAADRLRQQLALDADCSREEILIAATQRVAELEEHIRQRQAEDRVSAAVAQGKLITAQHDWAVQLCLRDESLFDEWLRTAAVVVPPGRLEALSAGRPAVRTSSIAASARAEYRAHPELGLLTTEEAYAADAVRRTT